MKRLILVLSLGTIFLSACMGAPATTTLEPAVPSDTAPAPTETPISVIPSDTTPAPDRKLPAASFESQTYINEEAGFALDYPVGWTVKEIMVGDRGSQIQFLSSPELADAATLLAGATRVNATIYQWDPKNDLTAFVANQKTAWDASGFTILEEEQLVLELGLPAARFTVQTPETQVVFLIAALRDRYLVLNGEGDLALVNEIVQRLRPISR